MSSLNDALAAARAQIGGYVYFLADPRTPRVPRYVGSTKDAAARAYQHTKPSGGRAPMQAWKAELRAVGLRPLLVVISTHAARQEATEAEWRVIGRWSRRGLCDLNSGVEGQWQRFVLTCAARLARQGAAA